MLSSLMAIHGSECLAAHELSQESGISGEREQVPIGPESVDGIVWVVTSGKTESIETR